MPWLFGVCGSKHLLHFCSAEAHATPPQTFVCVFLVVTIVCARSRQHHRYPTRIDATIAGDVGTINGFALCVSGKCTAAGGSHRRPPPAGRHA